MPGIGSLIVDMQLRMAEFTKSTNDAKGQLKSIGDAANAAAGLIKTAFAGIAIGRVVGEFKELVNTADSIGDVGAAFGVASERMGEFYNVGRLAGLEVNELTKIFKTFAVQVASARGGDNEAVKLLQALSISADELRTKDMAGLFQQAISEVNRFEGGANKIDILTTAFGKSGIAMDKFAGKVDEMIPVMQKLGGAFSDELTKQSGEFNDQMTLIAINVEKVKISILNDLLPVLNSVAKAFLDARKEGAGFFSAIASGIRAYTLGDEVALTEKNLAQLSLQLAQTDQQLQRYAKQREALLATPTTPVNARERSVELAAIADRTNKALADRVKITKELATYEANLTVLRNPKLLTGSGATSESGTKPAPAILKGGSDTAFADAKALAEKQIKELQRVTQDASEQAGREVELLQSRLSAGLLSYATFYAAKEGLQRQALAVQAANTAQEIKLLESIRGKAKSESERASIDTKIGEATAKLGDAQAKVQFEAVKGFIDMQTAAEAYRRKVDEIGASLLELTGKTREASLARNALAQEGIRREATQRGDSGTVAKLDEQARLIANQAQINDLLQQSSVIQDQLSNSEERARLGFETGAAGELTTLQRVSEARKAAAQQLSAISDTYRLLAADSGNPQLVQQAENFRVQLERLAATSDLVKDKFKSIGESAFGDFLSDVVTGTKKVSDAFKDMANSILQQVSRIAAQDIAKGLFGSLSSASGSSSSGGSSFFGGLLETVVKAFTRADGGPVRAGSTYLVGERGPEIFTARQNGTILPNGVGLGGGGNSVSVTINMPPGSSRETAMQAAARAGQAVQIALRRNG